ncbi:hypothetical protein QOZ80_7BG0587790 [Eleusine coracana subsp. coracana]|nr:hypothetical protein QOZ80_7BG0587790 [Eleusine coracana subsp. coracana]
MDGLFAAYEASYLAFPGEPVLDDARALAVERLRELQVPSFVGHGRRERRQLPLHWRPPRLQAMWSLQRFCDDGDCRLVDPSVLQLSKVDFNLTQAVHREELVQITKWWTDSGLSKKLPFARDRLVECFFCAVCIAPEPHLGACREVISKVCVLVIHLDDIYDVYGVLDELEAFTDAIGRWARESVFVPVAEALPEYMKEMLSIIFTTSATAAGGVLKEQGYDVLPLYKKAWHDLCKAFLVEAQWQKLGFKPSFKEYLSNGWVSSSGPLMLLHALPTVTQQQYPIMEMLLSSCGSDDVGTLPLIDYPRLIQLSSRMFRLCNDMASHKAESERSEATSSIDCCMAEMRATEEEARGVVEDAIAQTWKELNMEVVVTVSAGISSPWSTESMKMASLCLNLARTSCCVYQGGDGITSPADGMDQLVKALLFDPIPMALS